MTVKELRKVLKKLPKDMYILHYNTHAELSDVSMPITAHVAKIRGGGDWQCVEKARAKKLKTGTKVVII